MQNKKQQKVLSIFGIIIVVVAMYFWLIPDANWQGVKVTRGDVQRIKLPDGSLAILYGPAQLGYPKSFGSNVRKVKMEGAIYFDIKNNPKQTFLIQSDKGGVETRGGQVALNTNNKKTLGVYCFNGQARMIAKGKKKIFELNLEANQMSHFTIGDGYIDKKPLDSLTIPFIQN